MYVNPVGRVAVESRYDCPRQSLNLGFAARSTTPPTRLDGCPAKTEAPTAHYHCHSEERSDVGISWWIVQICNPVPGDCHAPLGLAMTAETCSHSFCLHQVFIPPYSRKVKFYLLHSTAGISPKLRNGCGLFPGMDRAAFLCYTIHRKQRGGWRCCSRNSAGIGG